MAGLTPYILDTTTISDLFIKGSPVQQQIRATHGAGHRLILCQPTHYEVLRGLLKVSATRKLEIFRSQFVPLFEWVPLVDADWEQAAHFWAGTTSRGRQFSDIDLLVAAVASRLGDVIVSSDADFEALAIPREDWRIPPQST